MSSRQGWTRRQLLVAFKLYCQMPFGMFHSRNPEIIRCAGLIGRTPSSLAMKLSNIASLDPEITNSGKSGLKGASAADRAMWDEMQSDWSNFAVESHEAYLKLGGIDDSELAVGGAYADQQEIDYTGADKIALAKVRVGQGFFRKAVLSAYDNKCCITGLSVPDLLVASHIVPWRIDEKNRLNPKNGLSLSMLHDRAFDLGIITINEDMTVRVSNKGLFDVGDFCKSALFSYHGLPISLPEKFIPDRDFLNHHRVHVFEKREMAF